MQSTIVANSFDSDIFISLNHFCMYNNTKGTMTKYLNRAIRSSFCFDIFTLIIITTFVTTSIISVSAIIVRCVFITTTLQISIVNNLYYLIFHCCFNVNYQIM